MTELAPHDHDLDGKLHDGCPMCEESKRRMPGAMRDKRADAEAQALADKVRASGRYRS